MCEVMKGGKKCESMRLEKEGKSRGVGGECLLD